MARHGVTYDDVIEAANSLKVEGKSITIENIRRFLGTGSAGTVNQHLRRWKEIQNTTQKIASKENLPEPLIALVKGLWESVLHQSTEQFTSIESNYQQEITELKADLEKYRANNQRWQKLFNEWQQEKSKLANELLTVEQALEFTHKENQSFRSKHDGFLQQLQEKQERIEELHRLHQQTQANLEHYRDSAREQRLLDQQQFEHEKQQLQLELRKVNELLLVERNNHEILKSEHYQLILKYDVFISNHATLKTEYKQLNEHILNIEQEKSRYYYESERWKSQNLKLEQDNSKIAKQLIHFQVEVQSLEKQFKYTVTTLEEQNKSLAHEKLVLVQEKIQIERQLNEIQKMNT